MAVEQPAKALTVGLVKPSYRQTSTLKTSVVGRGTSVRPFCLPLEREQMRSAPLSEKSFAINSGWRLLLKGNEARGMLLSTILIFQLGNALLLYSAFFSAYFAFLSRVALAHLLFETALLLLLLYSDRNMHLVTGLLLIDTQVSTLVLFSQFGFISEFMLRLSFIPVLLFTVKGVGQALCGMVLISVQTSIFCIVSTSLLSSTGGCFFVVPPILKCSAVLMMFSLTGLASFVHSNLNHHAEFPDVNMRLQQQLHDAGLAKSQFMANISHELRTPLHGIIASTSLLFDSAALTPATKENVKTIKDCSEHMLVLINNLLDLERILRRQIRLEFTTFHLAQDMESLIGIFTPVAAQKRVELRKNVSISSPIRMGDPMRLNQIIFNLLSNAIKFTPEGGLVAIRICDKGEELMVEVEDNGIGIAEEQTEHLFKGFCQMDPSSTRCYGGFGVGLSVSKQLCSLMGGRLHFSSTLGQGSKFWFAINLPVDNLNSQSIAVPSALAIHHNRQPLLGVRHWKILFVEDNLVNQRVGLKILHSLGLEVKLARNGLECILAMEEEDFDAVLMDCQMPVMDGFEASHKIRQMEKQRASKECQKKEGDEVKRQPRKCRIPIIAVSASATVEYQQNFIESGMDDWLSKPFTKSSLSHMICKWQMADA